MNMLRIAAMLLFVWTTTEAHRDGFVYVNTTDVRTAVRRVRRACPEARIVSARKSVWNGQPVTALEFVGSCEVPVASW